jgi:hypothetical protein
MQTINLRALILFSGYGLGRATRRRFKKRLAKTVHLLRLSQYRLALFLLGADMAALHITRTQNSAKGLPRTPFV